MGLDIQFSKYTIDLSTKHLTDRFLCRHMGIPIMQVSLSDITHNPYQVREISTDEELQELADSIREHGLLQPIKVRPVSQGFELVYGHRRLAAMLLLGWASCEVLVDEVSDDDSLIQSIVENLQRKNLDVLDEARSYHTLVERGHKLKEIAELVKKPQGRISNRLSILRLPPEVQKLVRSRKGQHETTAEMGGLSADSASRIASAANMPEEAMALAEKIIDERLNSREVRDLTRLLKKVSESAQRNQILTTRWEVTAGQPQQLKNGRIEGQLSLGHTDSFSEEIHNKIVWNLHRLDLTEFDHFTIGYSGRSVEQFIELLQLAGVELLADVRHSPVSRFRPEFSKLNLKTVIMQHGISYAHWPDLGIPSEIRRSSKTRDIFDWYDTNINPEFRLAKHDAQISKYRTAFMCVEVNPQSCHRHRIATHLEKTGLRLLDL